MRKTKKQVWKEEQFGHAKFGMNIGYSTRDEEEAEKIFKSGLTERPRAKI